MKTIKIMLVDDEEDFVTTVSNRINKKYGFESDAALNVNRPSNW